MVLRILLRYLTQNEQLITKISESYPIKRAAQLTTYLFLRGKEIGYKGLERTQEARQSGRWLGTFKDNFQNEIKEGWKDLSKQMKSKR